MGWQVIDENGNLKTVTTEVVALPALTNGKVWIGNGANVAAEQTPSGDVSMTNAGVFTVLASISKAITGIWSFSYDKLNLYNAAATFYHKVQSLATANRTIIFPDKDLTVAGVDDVYFYSPSFVVTGFSPADSTTYYFGIGGISGLTTTDTNVDSSLGVDVTVIGAVVTVANNTTSGSAENATFKLRNVTDALSSTLGTGATNGSNTVQLSHTFTGLSINVDAADMICGQIDTPAWATNPVSAQIRISFICKRR